MSKLIKSVVWLIFISLISFNVAVFAKQQQKMTDPSSRELDRVVAIVNDDVITQSELNLLIEQTKTQLQMQGEPVPSSANPQFRKQMLNSLINQKLQLQLAKKNAIKISDKQLNDAIAHIASEHHLTIDALKRELANEGVSFQDFKKQIHTELLILSVQQQFVKTDVTVTDEEINQLGEKYRQAEAQKGTEYHIYDLVVPLPDHASASQIKQIKEKAQQLYHQLKNNADFIKIVKQYPGNDLGWRSLADSPDLFAPYLNNMEINQVAGPIQTPNGFHIIKLLGKRQKKTETPSKKQLQEMLYQKKSIEQKEKWLDSLRHSAYIKIIPDHGE